MLVINTKEKNNVIRIAYGANESQFGDLRIPDGTGPFPLAMIIHGGFWRARFDLEQMNEMAEAFTAKGIATWNIEYRRVGQEGGGWPGTFLDNAAAVDYIRVLAKSYPLDVSRVITIGHSAGGHLALWLGTRHKLPSNSMLHTSEHPLPLKGVISLAGANDLETMHDIHQWKETLFGIVDNPTRDLLGGKPNEQAERYKEGSPYELLPIGIPLVLIHGSLDVNVPIGLSEHFEKEALKEGDSIILKTIPMAEHFELILPETESWLILLESANRLLGRKN
ncbi:S9 family peptidase [Sporosarcina sp.]|uniref:alpha/beta hydrolase family protein n=1 Tax=Sporosarcina sp. TaxID=49982 RepID=UPI0026125420|nr:alpha/beta hydrolase [Sporosarcina sp.]